MYDEVSCNPMLHHGCGDTEPAYIHTCDETSIVAMPSMEVHYSLQMQGNWMPLVVEELTWLPYKILVEG